MSAAQNVVIIDAGGANLGSVRAAFARLGVMPEVSRDPERIAAADRLVLPGVGAAPPVMRRLREGGIDRVLRDWSRPLLGICIGMQVLFERSEEGDVDGLGLIHGRVRRFDLAGRTQPDGSRYKVPQMGWNRVTQVPHGGAIHPVWAGVPDDSYFYFVHSFYAQPADAAHCAGEADYGGRFAAAIARDNIFATQFHLE